MIPQRPPKWVRALFSDVIWEGPNDNREVFLTFDDGPTPGITGDILDILADFDAYASFFCLGTNVREYPEICRSVADAGHEVGNHALSHMDPWKLGIKKNLAEFAETQKLLEEAIGRPARIYRPPYGHFTPGLIKTIAPQAKFVMWNLMPADFDPTVSAAMCLERIKKNARPGSIIVLHDNVQSAAKVRDFLPKVLQHFQSEGLEAVSLARLFA